MLPGQTPLPLMAGVGLPLALAMALCTLLAVGARTRYLHVELRISMLLKVCCSLPSNAAGEDICCGRRYFATPRAHSSRPQVSLR